MLISLMTSRYKTIDPFTANSRVRLISIVEFNWLKNKKKFIITTHFRGNIC